MAIVSLGMSWQWTAILYYGSQRLAGTMCSLKIRLAGLKPGAYMVYAPRHGLVFRGSL
jgi:hypothetical protein